MVSVSGFFSQYASLRDGQRRLNICFCWLSMCRRTVAYFTTLTDV
jgi:hypothetical protein